MIERFVLPQTPSSVKKLVDGMRGRTFDRVQNPRKRELLAGFVSQKGEGHVDMVRHYDHSMEQHASFVFMQAVRENKVACSVRKDAVIQGAEANAVRSIVALYVRQVPSIIEL